MSLDQAANPQEFKRDLKREVFHAIQGKYMPGKTVDLVKDMNTIAADILGDEATEPEPCVDLKLEPMLFDEVMFRCVDGDYYKAVEVDQVGTPVSEELMLNSTVYYRHKIGLIDDDDYVIYWFYSHIKDLSGWVFDVKYELWTKLRAHSQRDKPAAKKNTKTFMFQLTGERFGDTVKFDDTGRPMLGSVMIQGVIYHRHSISMECDGCVLQYWFYSISKTLDGWTNKTKLEMWQDLRDFDIAHSKDAYESPSQTEVLSQDWEQAADKAASQAIMDQPYNADDDNKACAQSEGAHGSAGDKPKPIPKSAPHIFIGGNYDGQTRDFNLDDMGMPLAEKIKINTVNVGSELYYRHSITAAIKGFVVQRWFYMNQEEPDSWTKENVTVILDRINKFFDDRMKGCDQSQAAADHKDILCIGGDVDGKAINVPCGSIGKPLQKAIYPMNGIQKYYLHSLTVGFDRTAKTYYFYSPKQDYTDLLPRSAATALDLLIEFYKDKKED